MEWEKTIAGWKGWARATRRLLKFCREESLAMKAPDTVSARTKGLGMLAKYGAN
jgi:hypothetical protein